MSRSRKKYLNGQKRHSVTPNEPKNRNPKDYHRMAVQFHGGELAWEKAMEKARGQSYEQ